MTTMEAAGNAVETEMFSNPIAPQEEEEIVPPTDTDEKVSFNKLSNSDFRKLMMTPRADKKTTSTASDGAAVSTAGKGGHTMGPPTTAESAMERRKKKKAQYAKVKKLEQERDDDLASRYRDRAKERREVAQTTNADGESSNNDAADNLNTTADYRAVAPTSTAGESYAERRRQVIDESKYLGGDMEHTHLVKGLDFALLEKVRAEITSKEREAQELDLLAEQAEEESAAAEKKEEEKMEFVSPVGKAVYRVLFKRKPKTRNELFAPGRMAYRIDLEEEYAELDVPTTVIRSKADCLPVEGQASGLTTNEMVINKLTQILSYLRAGRRQAKKAKLKGKLAQGGKDEEKVRPPEADMDIFEESGDYLTVPSTSKRRAGEEKAGGGHSTSRNQPGKDRDHRDKDYRDRGDRDTHRGDRDRDTNDRERRGGGDRERERGRRERGGRRSGRGETSAAGEGSGRSTEGSGRAAEGSGRATEGSGRATEGRKSYFEKPEEEREAGGYRDNAVKEMRRKLAGKMDPVVDQEKSKEKESIDRIRRKTEISGYDECYPGFAESYDAMGDSDDEADFSQMDMGNKKGPVGRWDFENQDDYSAYMSNKEAMPKAAFQYGVKMVDGRRTRRLGPKDERAELNRQWQKIQSLMNKRKEMADSSSAAKQAKYD